MAKQARRYDFYLPLTFNDGRAIPDDYFEDVERRLLGRFGGVTAQQREFPLRGIWQGESRLYLDQVIIMTVLDFQKAGQSRFIRELKQRLIRRFEQEEILVTESSLRVH